MRRLTVECLDCGKQAEILIGIDEEIPECPRQVSRQKMSGKIKQTCMGTREIVWNDGSAGFRVKGLTKRF